MDGTEGTVDRHLVEARYWTRTDDGRVRCDLCPRACQLGEGQRGVCFVRMNQGGRLMLTTYGRSSGFCVDPVEKKPLYHFYPGSPILSFGTAGCNLKCKFCQNWDISTSRNFDRSTEEASRADDCEGGQSARLPLGRLHLQRSGRISRVCRGRRRRLP